METASHRASVGIDAGRLSFELARRGITAETLAGRAGIPPASLSRIRHGRGVSARTLRSLADALLSFPIHQGADLLLREPE